MSDRSVQSAGNDNLDKKTLFVRSIPFDATSEQLTDFFSQFCPVRHAVVVNDAEGQSRGFGFVSFAMDEDTQTALDKSRTTKFQGRMLRVDIAKRRDRKVKNQEDSSSSPSSSKVQKEQVEKRKPRLIIRNLPWSVRNPEQLKKIFSKYGVVTDAFIPRKKGGQMSGFAFVTMKKYANAQNAIKESEGLKIDDREVAVDFALEKSKWLQYKDEHDEDEDEDEDGQEEVDEEVENGQEEVDEEVDEGQEEELEDSDNADVANSDSDDSDVELDSDEDVEESQEKELEKSRPKANRQENFSIFVRNIPYDTESEDLKQHFEKFGPVKYALPVIDKETGLAKGTAFVAFYQKESYEKCLANAPESSTTSILISDDVSPDYVFEGRILSISPTVDRESASRLTEKNAQKRMELLGKTPGERDKRNLYLLNEGRITENSKLASKLSKSDLELREKSYKLRVQHLNKNPSLHLSLTRLAIRNLPRAMNAKALKALARKAVVQFATEVKDGKRQPLTKEEAIRSQKEKERWQAGEVESNRSKKQGVVRQAKIIMEVKGSGDAGRSRGYGFLEFRDHKTALMGLRWLNAHEVTPSEILEGLDDEEKKIAELEGLAKRKLIVEFAIEHANIVKRRREKMLHARKSSAGKKQGNTNKGMHVGKKTIVEDKEPSKSGLDDDTKKLIGMKRKRRQQKRGK
ncbi:mRNA-binding ribosome biosynthesis protein NOP4 [Cyberlindnera jadinii NRRL Y-1542]|uniref:RNA recognition motif-containing protein n=1 Tax=Cyberlindnera jadinii (strain ATCC 18201 / CBS 1600 / BCRC 20928 / JCM 3617 / NBRC 0987 / NRRL Y-1542) TaxID=983966 RepID=A0A1E4RUL1_CYBJN|nr:RNA recognition motif-containing protein [Cyberlindnera jadinii NRRL Y-1542]ODV70936.1 RNA recognition motif-containing protein [Cyberlindnera jadinii NRRL Y-1542]